jgi:hypothetical protein
LTPKAKRQSVPGTTPINIKRNRNVGFSVIEVIFHQRFFSNIKNSKVSELWEKGRSENTDLAEKRGS